MSRPATTDVLSESATEIDQSIRGFRLEVVGGPDTGATFESENERATVGTHSSCDFQLTDPSVSRFHCEIIVVDGGLTARDLESSNHTFVDGLRIKQAYVNRGSILRLGRDELRVDFLGRKNRIELSSNERFGRLVGRSAAMRMMFARLERAAHSDISLLIEGETGTGKSAVARSIHDESPRKHGPFRHLDCASIPATLIESELFGHQRGAFTGAVERSGAFEDAHEGTLFLDEIGELPLELQGKLLHVLEERRVRRLGSNIERKVDIRIIAATNRDLRTEVNHRRFREDLYFRLAVGIIHMPPLRRRMDDLPYLVEALFKDLNKTEHQIHELMTDEMLASLRAMAWPGNVRELRNRLERYIVFDTLIGDLETHGQQPTPERENIIEVDADLPYAEARRQVINAFERKYTSILLRRHGGRVVRAAEDAGLHRSSFHKIVHRHPTTDDGEDSAANESEGDASE